MTEQNRLRLALILGTFVKMAQGMGVPKEDFIKACSKAEEVWNYLEKEDDR